jgi:hypothetical protein
VIANQSVIGPKSHTLDKTENISKLHFMLMRRYFLRLNLVRGNEDRAVWNIVHTIEIQSDDLTFFHDADAVFRLSIDNNKSLICG